MQIIWKDEDISDKVKVGNAVLYDVAGEYADSVDIYIPDPEKLWAYWEPSKGDTFKLKEGNFTTGLMYFDGWQLTDNLYIIRGISTPFAGKTSAIRSWNKAEFIRIAKDISEASGLKLNTYEIENHIYQRLDQTGEGNLAFLNYLCKREGYSLKITDGRAIIFNEKLFEGKEAVKTIYKSDMLSGISFKSSSVDLKSACIARCFSEGTLIEHKEIDSSIYGGEIEIKERLFTVEEAKRFAKAALRQANKYEFTGDFSISINTDLAAASCINIANLGHIDGQWYIYKIKHDIKNGITHCWVRKPIEGEY
jgi:phage protein D